MKNQMENQKELDKLYKELMENIIKSFCIPSGLLISSSESKSNCGEREKIDKK